MLPRQSSIRFDAITQEQLADLSFAGFGEQSAIIRRAIDRMHREEMKRRKFTSLDGDSSILALYQKIVELIVANTITNGVEDLEAVQLVLANMIYGAENATGKPMLARVIDRVQRNVELIRGYEIPDNPTGKQA